MRSDSTLYCGLFVGWALIARCEEQPQVEFRPPNRVERNALALWLELSGSEDPHTLDFREHFRVVLSNNSDEPLRVWNPETKQGFYQFSFEFKNLRSGETLPVRKRRDIHRRYWQWSEENPDPESETIVIPPHDNLVTQITFSARAYNDLVWTGLPTPNSEDVFLVSAEFESTIPEDDLLRKVWTGKIQGKGLNTRFVAWSCKSPHDYLKSGFSAQAIKMMSDDRTWISAKDHSSCTPLHHAASHGQMIAISWLLDHGADVGATAYNDYTPLHLVETAEVVELFLEKQHDATVNCIADHRSLLYRALKNLVQPERVDEQEKWRRIVKLYLENGAEYDIVAAIHLDDLERVKAILEKSPEHVENFPNESPLRCAAALGRLDICRYLVESYPVDVNDFRRGRGFPILTEALQHPQVVELLVESGADLTTTIRIGGMSTGMRDIGDNATALHYAAAQGTPDTVALLINNGIGIFAKTDDSDETDKCQTALEIAALRGKADNAEAIVCQPSFGAADPGLRQESLDKSLLIGASSCYEISKNGQRLQLIKVLLDHGANPNISEDGASAMQFAAEQIHPTGGKLNAEIKQIVILLRDHGAKVDLFSAVAIADDEEVHRLLKTDPNSANSYSPDGYPALHFAVAMNYQNIVTALLAAGGNVGIRNKSDSTGHIGGTALHCAAFWGRHEIARLLIGAGADVNALSAEENTPLHDAARMTNVNIARLLLENGATLDALNIYSDTPLDWCRLSRGKNAAEIEALFREFKAKHAK